MGEWVVEKTSGVTAFYDIDTPVTIAGLERGDLDYLSRNLIPRYQLYLSFTGGSILERIEREFGSPRARPLYCSVDPALYFPEACDTEWDLGYLGTYSADRQPTLEELLMDPARAGRTLVLSWRVRSIRIRSPGRRTWQRIVHLSPADHRHFYCQQRFTLNVTRQEMVKAGYSPSVRLFEAAACGIPIISDCWEGLETIFEIGEEILIARTGPDVLRYLREMPERNGLRSPSARAVRVLNEHTSAHRAAELESYALECLSTSERGLADV